MKFRVSFDSNCILICVYSEQCSTKLLQNWQFEGNIWPAKPEHLPQVFCWTQPATQQGRHAVVMLAMATITVAICHIISLIRWN